MNDSRTDSMRQGRVKPNNRLSPGPIGNTQGLIVPQTSPNASGAGNSAPPPQSPAEESGWWASWGSDLLHGGLDVVGLIPVVGEIADGANALIYLSEGDKVNAALSAAAMLPVGGQAATASKWGKKAGEAAGVLKKGDDAAEAAKGAGKAEPPSGGRVDGPKKRQWEIGKCGEWLAKNDLREAGYDEVVEVQNKSGHGVDVVGRNSQTGEVKVLEVKTTSTDSAPPLSKDQKAMGGKRYTDDRVGKAAGGSGHYKNSPSARANGRKVLDWIDVAGRSGANVSYEKYDVFIEDPEQGCIKKKAKGSAW